MEKQEKNTVTPYDLDGRPPLKLAIPLGLAACAGYVRR